MATEWVWFKALLPCWASGCPCLPKCDPSVAFPVVHRTDPAQPLEPNSASRCSWENWVSAIIFNVLWELGVNVACSVIFQMIYPGFLGPAAKLFGLHPNLSGLCSFAAVKLKFLPNKLSTNIGVLSLSLFFPVKAYPPIKVSVLQSKPFWNRFWTVTIHICWWMFQRIISQTLRMRSASDILHHFELNMVTNSMKWHDPIKTDRSPVCTSTSIFLSNVVNTHLGMASTACGGIVYDRVNHVIPISPIECPLVPQRSQLFSSCRRLPASASALHPLRAAAAAVAPRGPEHSGTRTSAPAWEDRHPRHGIYGGVSWKGGTPKSHGD